MITMTVINMLEMINMMMLMMIMLNSWKALTLYQTVICNTDE